jgi:hypothetical protein
MMIFPIPGILGTADGGTIRKFRKAEGADYDANLLATSDS